METCCFGEISGLEWHLVLSVLYFDEFIFKIKQVVGFVSCVCLSVCLFVCFLVTTAIPKKPRNR